MRNNKFYIFSIIVLLCLGYLSRPPFYGKMKFIYLDTFFPILEIVQHIEKESNDAFSRGIVSDPVTEYMLSAFTGVETKTYWRQYSDYSDNQVNLKDLLYHEKRKCILNLRGFPKTWVPELTFHWNGLVSNTKRLYDIKSILNNNSLKTILESCIIIL